MNWTKQRGTAFGYWIVLSIYGICGYRLTKVIIFFIAMYYTCFDKDAYKYLMNYHKRINIPLTFKNRFTHFYVYAISIFDRFISAINPEHFQINVSNNKVVFDNIQGGLILVSAHFGSWQTAQNLIDFKKDVSIVGYEQTTENINKLFQNKKQNISLINLAEDSTDFILSINQALKKNGIVMMMGDRYINNKYTAKHSFLGDSATFNTFPYHLAYLKKLPVCFIFTPRVVDRQYDLYITKTLSPLDFNCKNDFVNECVEQYSASLEAMCMNNKFQWYNFYNFWNE